MQIQQEGQGRSSYASQNTIKKEILHEKRSRIKSKPQKRRYTGKFNRESLLDTKILQWPEHKRSCGQKLDNRWRDIFRSVSNPSKIERYTSLQDCQQIIANYC